MVRKTGSTSEELTATNHLIAAKLCGEIADSLYVVESSLDENKIWKVLAWGNLFLSRAQKKYPRESEAVLARLIHCRPTVSPGMWSKQKSMMHRDHADAKINKHVSVRSHIASDLRTSLREMLSCAQAMFQCKSDRRSEARALLDAVESEVGTDDYSNRVYIAQLRSIDCERSNNISKAIEFLEVAQHALLLEYGTDHHPQVAACELRRFELSESSVDGDCAFNAAKIMTQSAIRHIRIIDLQAVRANKSPASQLFRGLKRRTTSESATNRRLT